MRTLQVASVFFSVKIEHSTTNRYTLSYEDELVKLLGRNRSLAFQQKSSLRVMLRVGSIFRSFLACYYLYSIASKKHLM